MLDGKVVLDMGSGTGMLAIEMEIRRQRGEEPVAKRVDSLNARYAHPQYKYQHWFLVLREKFGKSMGVAEIRNAIHTAKKHFLALDWNDLSAIPDETYDVICAVFSFPAYGDFIETKHKNMLDKGVVTVKWGPRSQNTFGHLTRILAKGGFMDLDVEWSLRAWTNTSPEVRNKIQDFFASRGCTLQLRAGADVGLNVEAPRDEAAPEDYSMILTISKAA